MSVVANESLRTRVNYTSVQYNDTKIIWKWTRVEKVDSDFLDIHVLTILHQH